VCGCSVYHDGNVCRYPGPVTFQDFPAARGILGLPSRLCHNLQLLRRMHSLRNKKIWVGSAGVCILRFIRRGGIFALSSYMKNLMAEKNWNWQYSTCNPPLQCFLI